MGWLKKRINSSIDSIESPRTLDEKYVVGVCVCVWHQVNVETCVIIILLFSYIFFNSRSKRMGQGDRLFRIQDMRDRVVRTISCPNRVCAHRPTIRPESESMRNISMNKFWPTMEWFLRGLLRNSQSHIEWHLPRYERRNNNEKAKKKKWK